MNLVNLMRIVEKFTSIIYNKNDDLSGKNW